MSFDNSCMYCTKDNRVSDLMIEICELKVSTFYLFKEQTHKGRCIVAFNKGHKGELFQLSEEERMSFVDDLSRASGAISKTFNPNKINYAAFGDKVPHLHFHLVPKYENGTKWGGMFDMMPEEKLYLNDEEYKTLIEKLKENL